MDTPEILALQQENEHLKEIVLRAASVMERFKFNAWERRAVEAAFSGEPWVLPANGDTPCPNDGELVNKRCWKCGWVRVDHFDAAAATLAEEQRQDAKWGQQDHPNGTGRKTMPLVSTIDTMHANDLAIHFTNQTDFHAKEGTVTWRDIFLEEVFEALAESDLDKLQTELTQCAAVAQQWGRAIDRQRAAQK